MGELHSPPPTSHSTRDNPASTRAGALHLLHREPTAHPPPTPNRAWDSARAPTPPPLPERISAHLHSLGYVPSGLLRAHIEVRDATCIGTTCHHPARGADLDHTVNVGHARDGVIGLTVAGNLGATCRGVHLRKTFGGWLVIQLSPGRFRWRTLLGYIHERDATPLIPGWNHDTDTDTHDTATDTAA